MNTDDSPVILERLCRRCFHDLCGHDRQSACTNCGTPVADSLDYAHFVQRSPWLVNRLIRGGRLVLWGNAAVLCLLMALIIFAPAVPQQPWILSGGLTLLGILEMAIHAGWWKLSMADPDARESKLLTARYVLRATVICSAPLLALNAVYLAVTFASLPPPGTRAPGPMPQLPLSEAAWMLYLVVCLLRAVVARMYCHWLIVLSTLDRMKGVPDYRFRWYQIILSIILPWRVAFEPIWMLTSVADVIARLKECRVRRARIVERIALDPELALDIFAEREESFGVVGAAS